MELRLETGSAQVVCTLAELEPRYLDCTKTEAEDAQFLHRVCAKYFDPGALYRGSGQEATIVIETQLCDLVAVATELTAFPLIVQQLNVDIVGAILGEDCQYESLGC